MKDITLITVIGSNRTFRDTSCPLRHNNPDYCSYFQDLTSGHNIVLSQEMMDSLPRESTPYPCRDVYVLGDPSVAINSKYTRARRIETIGEAIAMAQDSEHKTFVLADNALYNAFFKEYQDAITQLLIVELNEEFCPGAHFDPLPTMDWPSLLRSEKFDREKKLIYRITMYRNEPVH